MARIEIDLSNIEDVFLPKFRPILWDTNRFILLMGGRGSGKTIAAAAKCVFRVLDDLDKPDIKHTILAMRKHSANCQRSVVREIQDVIDRWGLEDIVEYNKTTKTFTFIDESRIMCTGLDESSKIKSIQGLTGAWAEEAEEFVYDDIVAINLSMRGDRGTYFQFILSFNPTSTNSYLYDKFYRGGEEKPGITYHHSTYRDNSFLDEDFVDQLDQMCGANDNLRDILINGKWGVLDGLIFSPNQWSVEDMDDRLEGEIIYGLDFGWNHPTALIMINRIDENTFYLKELFFFNKTPIPTLIECMNKCINDNADFIFADGARPEHIDDIFRAGFNIHPADKKPGSVFAGLTYLKRFKFVIHPDSKNLISEIQSYEWKKSKTGETLEEPVKEHDHCLDAVRYCIFSHYHGMDSGAKVFL